MKNNVIMPPFGDILNAAIQVVKSYITSKKGISFNAFQSDMVNALTLTDAQMGIGVLDPDLDSDMYSEAYIDEYLLENAFGRILELVVKILNATGIIMQDAYPLLPNKTHENLFEFVAFNTTVTSDNLVKIDPFG